MEYSVHQVFGPYATYYVHTIGEQRIEVFIDAQTQDKAIEIVKQLYPYARYCWVVAVKVRDKRKESTDEKSLCCRSIHER